MLVATVVPSKEHPGETRRWLCMGGELGSRYPNRGSLGPKRWIPGSEGVGGWAPESEEGELDGGTPGFWVLTTPAKSHWLMLRPQSPRAGTGCSASEPQAWPAVHPGSASKVRSSPPPAAPSAALPERRSAAQSPRAVADRSLWGRARQWDANPAPAQPRPPRSPPRPLRKK